MGLPASILSGDSEAAVDAVAADLGIQDARGALGPAGKVEALARFHDASERVVMVGDGVNDAPALAAADVGCAIGSGSEAALATSDVALLSNDLQGVPAAIGMARSTYAVIVQNFGWAMGYNVAALPLAATGLLDPLVAAVAMGLSSVLVVLNSLRLSRLGRSGPSDVGSRTDARHQVGCGGVGGPPGPPVRLTDRGEPGGLAGAGAVPPADPSLDHHDRPSPRRIGRDLLHARRGRGQPAPPHLLGYAGPGGLDPSAGDRRPGRTTCPDPATADRLRRGTSPRSWS